MPSWSISRRSLRYVIAMALGAAGSGLLTAIPASAQGPVNYVALGDSYSSGLGAGNYSGGSCERSANAYPVLWANAHGASLINATCSGATTSDVINGQVSSLSSSTTLVSITIGGNDIGFAQAMETCVLSSTSTCVSAVNIAEQSATTVLPGALDTTFATIATDAPNAKVVVMDYPELYDLSRSAGCIGLSTTDRTTLNQGADVLASVIQAAAARHGDAYVDVRPAFAGHEICDGTSWIHAVDWFNLGVSYHPTAAGQADAYYPTFATVAG